MPNILNDITQGNIIPFADNDALSALSKILGTSLINGTPDATIPMLVQLSIGLNPIYLAVLISILIYIGIGGTIKTAMEGQFLGQQWNSFGVPAMFVICVILLSPVPTKQGVTLGQVVFVKGVVYGSNFADYALREVFRQSVTSEYAATPTNISTVASNLGQISSQLQASLPMYVCAEQITKMGYGTSTNYFFLLNEVCGVPPLLVGDYADYFTQSNPNFITSRNEEISAISAATGVDLGSMKVEVMPGVDAIKNRSLNIPKNNPTSQMKCQFKAFRSRLSSQQVPQTIADKMNVASQYPIEMNKNIPLQVNNDILPVRYNYVAAMWAPLLNDTYFCLQTEALVNLQENYKPPANTSVPWQGGWVNAAAVIADDLKDYKKSMAATPLEFNREVTKAVDPSKLGNTLMDKKNQSILTNQMTDLNKFMNEQDGLLEKAKLSMQGLYQSSPTYTNASLSDYAKIAAGLTVVKAMNNPAVNGSMVGPLKPGIRTEMFTKFMESTVGKISTVTAGAVEKPLGLATKYANRFFASLQKLMSAKEKLDKVAESAASAAGPVGWVGSLANLAKNAAEAILLPGPTAMMAASIALLAMNTITLLPQVILLVVMLIWLVKVAIWYMIIPIATVLIALPNTRVGHDIWKSALGIMLTPFFALLFYLISLNLTDVMFWATISWMISPIADAWNGNSGAMAGVAVIGSILFQMISGEIVFRFFITIALSCLTILYLSMMIVRGPDLVNRALGLGTSSDDLGRELTGVAERLDPSKRLTNI